ncbi:vascular cell adhesion protein 1-like [Arapaima gigas]
MRLFSVLVFILPAAVAAVPLAVKVTPRQAVSRIGDSLVAKCEVFCGETPRFLWKMLGDIPTFGVVKRNTASELVLDPVTIENEETFVCEASCGSSSGQNKLTVKVFSFPEDPVISGHGHLVAGKTVIVTCQVPRVYPPEHLKIEWLQNGRVVSEVNGMDEGGRSVQTVSSTHTFEPTAEDHGGNLSCRATLELPGVPDDQKTRESAVHLTVQTPPRKTTVSVSPAGELREGDPLTLLCQSDGEPACHLVLRRLTEDQYTELKSSVGSSLSHTIPSARLEDSGRYECEAINHHGSQTNTVEVVVRAPPRNTTVQVTPSWNVFQGQDVTVSCSTVSFPAAKAILRRLSDGNELSSPDCVFRLLNVTPGDAGSYQLSVSNELGQETEHFNLSVVEKYTNPPKEDPVSKVIPTVVASVSLLSIVTLLTSFLWKARRMSSYQMTASSTV